MDALKLILQGIVGLFMVSIFITMIIELGQVTGQNVTMFVVSMIFMGVGLVAAIAITIYKSLFD